MSLPFLDTAIVKAMRADPNATASELRAAMGCTKQDFDAAVKRLRWAGKMPFGRKFALSPSMQSDSQPPVGNASGTGAAKGECRISRRKLPAPPTIADEVKAEAQANGQRRTMARKISATAMDPLPPPAETMADKFRRLARELDEEEQAALDEAEAEERRERDLDRLTSPSAVLRRAQRDWPTQCADVAAMAKELGIGLGECWRRVIKAGVDCMRDCGPDEEATV